MNFEPTKLDNYVGQENVKNSIRVSMQAAKIRKESFPHVLLHGASGLGKTTLANLIAKEFKSKCTTLLAPTISSHDIIYDALENCKKNDFIFIDEVHALPRVLQETVYTAMTDRKIERKDQWGSYQVDLKPFTCLTATTELGELAAPFRERFGFIIPLDNYSYEEMEEIILMNAKKLKYKITSDALKDISHASRRNPRTANRLLDRCHDTATVARTKTLDNQIVDETLHNLQIEKNGLTIYDIRILQTLVYKFAGKPTGLKTLAMSTGIDEKAIESTYEPWLIELDLLERSSRGRVITKEGILYIAENHKKN